MATNLNLDSNLALNTIDGNKIKNASITQT